ncbi:MAG: hypothetical protein U9N39_09860 [Campylobacterota bacterium]|nr:hypothetical protein [Campylobacterota bacterium]
MRKVGLILLGTVLVVLAQTDKNRDNKSEVKQNKKAYFTGNSIHKKLYPKKKRK